MGRLTLNILLSFAQFEREVIGERIRDKFAASRARGMWMGGRVPLGYDVLDRKLVVNAGRGRPWSGGCSRGSSRLGSGTALARAAAARRAGPARPAGCSNKGDVYKLLNNRTYVGEAAHKGQVYPGEHKAIVSTRALGPGACRAAGEPAGAGQQASQPVNLALAEGADLWHRRSGAVTHPHTAAGAALSLLRGAARAEAGR